MSTRKPNTIDAAQCSNIRMVAGGEKRIQFVVDRGYLKEWVGIGWVKIRLATARDKRLYRTVI